MTTDRLHSEANYRTERATRHGTPRNVARLPHRLVRILWRPSRIVALIAAARGAATVDGAAHDALAAVGIPTELTTARA